MNLPTDVLQEVLEGSAPDSAEARSIRHDLDRIRRGMQMLTETPDEPTRSRPLLRPLSVAAGIAVVTAIGLAVNNARTERPSEPIVAASQPVAPPAVASSGPVTLPGTGDPGVALGVPAPALSLDERVRQADQIVVGTVTKVTRGKLDASGGESLGAYLLATVSVAETIKGEQGDVIAFDYDYGGTIVTSEVAPKPWAVGEQVLLFLVSDAGTVSEKLQPAHLQVAEGAAGRYAVKDGSIIGPFTLDEVRRLARG